MIQQNGYQIHFFHKGSQNQIKNQDLTKLMGSNETAAATWWQVALQNGQRGGMMALIALMIPLGINTNPF